MHLLPVASGAGPNQYQAVEDGTDEECANGACAIR
jgi:hypothetical protein